MLARPARAQIKSTQFTISTNHLNSQRGTFTDLKNEINTVNAQIQNQTGPTGAAGTNSALNTEKAELNELRAEEKVVIHQDEEEGEIDLNSEIITNNTLQGRGINTAKPPVSEILAHENNLALPPEINSARMYSGAGSTPLLSAANAWDSLAAELESVHLPPTVSPPHVVANRAEFMEAVATNMFGQNTPAIAANEAQYGEMWAQDVSAMVGYHAGASTASSASTTSVLAAGTDEVSAAIAAQFGAHGQQYQELSQQAATFHNQFAQALGASSAVHASAANDERFADMHVAAFTSSPTAMASEHASIETPTPKLESLAPSQVEQIAVAAGVHELTTNAVSNQIETQSENATISGHDGSLPQLHGEEPPDLQTLTEAQIDSVLPRLTTQTVQSLTTEQLRHLHEAAVKRLGLTVPGQALFAATAFGASELRAFSSNGIVFDRDSKANSLNLLKGFVLFAPTADINVRTRQAVVSIPGGAVVWVMATGAEDAIFDFHDSSVTGPVKVMVNGQPIVLAPGTQVVLTENATARFDSMNPAKGLIGSRNVRGVDAGSGVKAYVCDFSIPDGMANISFLHAMVTSKNRQQQKLVHNMLKNAAILADLTGYDYDTATMEK